MMAHCVVPLKTRELMKLFAPFFIHSSFVLPLLMRSFIDSLISITRTTLTDGSLTAVEHSTDIPLVIGRPFSVTVKSEVLAFAKMVPPP